MADDSGMLPEITMEHRRAFAAAPGYGNMYGQIIP
jgi:hypothetical protein